LKNSKSASNSRDLKVLNRLLVLNTIRKNGSIARYEVAKVTGLTPPTVTVIVNNLIKCGVVKETGAGESNGGRKPVLLELEHRAGFILAVRLQHGEIMAALLDLTGNILESRYFKLDTTVPAEVVATIKDSLDLFIERAGIPREKVFWCGVASPGLIDYNKGIVVHSSNLGWHKVPLGEMLSQSLSGIAVHVENISNVAALGEKVYGGGRGLADLIYLNLSIGIGAGIIINNEVYNGTQGYAGEVGFMVLVPDSGPQRLFGKGGYFEAFCGVKAVIERVKSETSNELLNESGVPKHRLQINDLANPLIKEIPEVKKILFEVENLIGIAIANLVVLFNIPMVILGGELVGVISLAAINSKVKQYLLPDIGESVQVISSTMKEDPPLIGVYALVLEKLFSSDEWLQVR
jgi:predicted NBD/HSP70 family sugar kinase